MYSDIANSLGVGAGFNTGKIINDLAAASRGPKLARISNLTDVNQAKISAVAQVKSSLENFSQSLNEVAGSGGFKGAPTVSDESYLTATVSGSGLLGDAASEVEISQLARSQTVYSANVADPDAAIGQGDITLSVGGEDFTITIGADNDSLNGLAAAINDTASGVNAAVVSDGAGSRLVLKGETGADAAFTLSADAALASFTYDTAGGGMTLGQSARNAQFTIDGIAYSRRENEAADILPGLSLSFRKVTSGETITIGRDASNEAIRQNIDDFVAAFNTLRSEVDQARSTTRGDYAMRRLEQQLGSLIGQSLTDDPLINSLSDIGISTNRDGSISLDSAKLTETLADNPDAVVALFSLPAAGDAAEGSAIGVTLALKRMTEAALANDGLLTALDRRLDNEAASLKDDLGRVEQREAAYRTRLERQFGTLDARLASFQATQSYLEQQIQMWQNSDN